MFHFKSYILSLRTWLTSLSFRTGVIIIFCCLPCYALAFSLPFFVDNNWTKATVWVIFFGLAKAFQYTGLAIIGIEGWKRIKYWLRHRISRKHP